MSDLHFLGVCSGQGLSTRLRPNKECRKVLYCSRQPLSGGRLCWLALWHTPQTGLRKPVKSCDPASFATIELLYPFVHFAATAINKIWRVSCDSMMQTLHYCSLILNGTKAREMCLLRSFLLDQQKLICFRVGKSYFLKVVPSCHLQDEKCPLQINANLFPPGGKSKWNNCRSTTFKVNCWACCEFSC